MLLLIIIVVTSSRKSAGVLSSFRVDPHPSKKDWVVSQLFHGSLVFVALWTHKSIGELTCLFAMGAKNESIPIWILRTYFFWPCNFLNVAQLYLDIIHLRILAITWLVTNQSLKLHHAPLKKHPPSLIKGQLISKLLWLPTMQRIYCNTEFFRNECGGSFKGDACIHKIPTDP